MTVDICGNPDCTDELCDVVLVDEPIEPRHDIKGIWHFGRILNSGVPNPFEPGISDAEARERFANFYERAMRAYDATRCLEGTKKIMRGKSGDLVDDLRPLIGACLKLGYSMVDVPEVLDIPKTELLFQLARTSQSVVRTWTDEDWRRFEHTINAEPIVVTKLMTDFGLGNHMVATLLRLYGKKSSIGRKPAHPKWVREYVDSHPERGPAQLAAELKDMGVDISRATIIDWRKRRRRAERCRGDHAADSGII